MSRHQSGQYLPVGWSSGPTVSLTQGHKVQRRPQCCSFLKKRTLISCLGELAGSDLWVQCFTFLYVTFGATWAWGGHMGNRGGEYW